MFYFNIDWEDPGFVLIEHFQGFNHFFKLSNGPNEILENGNGGYLFKSNDQADFISKFRQFRNENDKQLKKRNLSFKKIKKLYLF